MTNSRSPIRKPENHTRSTKVRKHGRLDRRTVKTATVSQTGRWWGDDYISGSRDGMQEGNSRGTEKVDWRRFSESLDMQVKESWRIVSFNNLYQWVDNSIICQKEWLLEKETSWREAQEFTFRCVHSRWMWDIRVELLVGLECGTEARAQIHLEATDVNKNMLAGRSYSLEKVRDGVRRESHWPQMFKGWSAAEEPRRSKRGPMKARRIWCHRSHMRSISKTRMWPVVQGGLVRSRSNQTQWIEPQRWCWLSQWELGQWSCGNGSQTKALIW